MCTECGLELKHNSGKCKKCYNEYMRKHAAEKYTRRRTEWIERLGGCCVRCGSDQNLHFDHIDASTKKYDVGKIIATHAEEKVASEMTKCQLLCQPCHIQKTTECGDIPAVEHGGGKTGKKNCYCDLCAPLKRAYNYKYKYGNKRVPKVKEPYICGTYRTYKHGCRCVDCKTANTSYMKEFYKNRKQ